MAICASKKTDCKKRPVYIRRGRVYPFANKSIALALSLHTDRLEASVKPTLVVRGAFKKFRFRLTQIH